MYEDNQVENSALASIEERLNSRKEKGNDHKKKHPILEEILEEILSWIWSIAVESIIMAILTSL